MVTKHEYDARIRALVGTAVTLNGRPAIVCGGEARHGWVRTLAASGPDCQSFQWSWDAIARIVAAGGRFTS
jgi:hypothetical protein